MNGVEHEELSRNQQPASPSCFTQHLLWSRPVDRSNEDAPEKTKGTNATKNQCQLGLAKKTMRTTSLCECVCAFFPLIGKVASCAGCVSGYP